jgi:hypothetical protein
MQASSWWNWANVRNTVGQSASLLRFETGTSQMRIRSLQLGCRYGNYIVTCRGDYRRGFDWWMDLLATHTHDSEIQAISAPPLMTTIHKSPQHPLSLFHPAVSSPAVPWQRLIIVENLQLHELRSSSQPPLRKQLSTELCPLHLGTDHIENIVLLLLPSCPLFTEPLPRNGRGSDHKNTVLLLLRALPSTADVFTKSPFSNGSISHNTEM